MFSSGFHRLFLAGAVGCVVILSACAIVRAQRASRLVERVEVMGNRRLPAKEILTRVKTRAGNRFSQRQVQRDFQAVLDLGCFDKIGTRVSTEDGVRGGVVVIFEVKELPLILEVTFEGLGNVPETEVIDALRSKGINVARNAIYDVWQARQARIVIQRFLALRGRKVSVNVLIENVTGMSVRLAFVITNEASFE